MSYFNLFVFFCLGSLLVGCESSALREEPTNNRNFDVSFLFEHEGIRVYRFSDGWRAHYFTDRGETISTKSRPMTVSKQHNRVYWEENIQ